MNEVAARKVSPMVGLHMATTKQIAEYYGVGSADIYKVFRKNQADFEGMGCVKLTGRQIFEKCDGAERCGVSGFQIPLEDGNSIEIGGGSHICFSGRAAGRMGEYLRRCGLIGGEPKMVQNMNRDQEQDSQPEKPIINKEENVMNEMNLTEDREMREKVASRVEVLD